MAAILEKLPVVRIGHADITSIAKATMKEISDDDVPGLAGEMAYHSILAIFPFLLFLAGLTSIVEPLFGVSDLTDRIINKASSVMPQDATTVLRSFTSEVVHSRGGPAIAIGLIASIWAASGAIGVAMKGLNRAYDVKEDRGYLRRKLVAVALTAGCGGFIICATLLVGTGSIMAGGIGRALGWQQEFVQLWNWLTLPLGILLVVCAVALLYWLGPNTSHTFRWITPGALLFVVGWVVASLVFAAYIANFGSYNRTYGALGAVIVLLIWLYWSSFMLLVGGELNAVLAKRSDPEYRAEQGGSKPSNAGSSAQP